MKYTTPRAACFLPNFIPKVCLSFKAEFWRFFFAHAFGALLADVARTLQTAPQYSGFFKLVVQPTLAHAFHEIVVSVGL